MEARAFQRQVELAWHKAIREAILEEGLKPEAFRELVAVALDMCSVDDEINELSSVVPSKATERQLQALLFDSLVGDIYAGVPDKDRAAIAKLYRVDRKAIERGMKAAQKATGKVDEKEKKAAPVKPLKPIIKPIKP